MNLRLMTAFCISIGSVVIISPNAFAGYRRCQDSPDRSITYCVNETGFRYECVDYGSSHTVCKGKNYRKECFNDFVNRTGTCNDSNGVKTVCKHSVSTSVCENSKGVRSTCSSYDNTVSICTDVSRWGRPIKS
jgi:hypothetical protein